MKISSLPTAISFPWQSSFMRSGGPKGQSPRWSTLRRFISGTYALALADQVLVSATSFFSTVMVGRWTDPSQLGVYAIAISVLVSSSAIQESLISLPYSIQRHRPLWTPAEFAGSALAHSGLFSVVGVAVIAFVAFGLSITGSKPQLTMMAWALAAVMPFVLSREFSRRFAFAHLNMRHALLLDSAVAAIQLALLCWLEWTGRMSAVTACGALGAACAAVTVGWLVLGRADFAIRVEQTWPTMKQNWGLGKWFFLGQITGMIQHNIPYWLLALIAGAAATGIYAACMTVVLFVNPIVTSFRNISTPRLVLAWRNGGGVALRRQVMREFLLLAAIMGSFCIVVLTAGEAILSFIYHGNEYQGHGYVVSVLAFATMATALGLPPSNALASMERPRAIVVVGIVSAFLTVTAVWLLCNTWGLIGAAYGFLLGNVVGTAGKWAAFLFIAPTAYDDAPLVEVLRKIIPGTVDKSLWTISRLGEGDHAIVYAIESKDGQPIWQSHQKLVVKLYKPETLTEGMVEAQFASLGRLHSAVHGRTSHGWTIATPQALHICKAPLALIMTSMPGRDLNFCASAVHEVTPEILVDAARVLVGGMKESWAGGYLHGDITPQNILCDARAKILAFVDPGTPEACCVCNAETKPWQPSVLDLAHMLWAVATDTTDVVNPIARLRKQMFVESALRAFIGAISSAEAKQQAMDQIRACTRTHLTENLDVSWSLRGFWHSIVKRIAINHINSILARLEAELQRTGTTKKAAIK